MISSNKSNSKSNKTSLIKNPCSSLKQLSSVIDPKTLVQTEGPDSLMHMMKEINNNPDMMSMMRMGRLEGKNQKKR